MKNMKWYPAKFARNMVVLMVVLAVIMGVFALLDRALEHNDCANNRDRWNQTFQQCMDERYN